MTKRRASHFYSPQIGFTLIEIIIALFIFALLAVIAAVGLRTVINTHERVTQVSARIQQMEVAMTLMRRDFSQIIARPVVDDSGQLLPALMVSGTNHIEFTRAGNTNPDMLFPRSSLQRVAYSVVDNALVRITWPVLDRVENTQPLQRVILEHVQSMDFTYVNNKGQIVTNWVASTGANSATVSQFPNAIIVTLQLNQVGKMQAVFPIVARGPLT